MNIEAESQGGSSCDLRGLNSEDAATKMEDFISRAIVTKTPRVTIIHGHGDGNNKSSRQKLPRKSRSLQTVLSRQTRRGGVLALPLWSFDLQANNPFTFFANFGTSFFSNHGFFLSQILLQGEGQGRLASKRAQALIFFLSSEIVLNLFIIAYQ